jgi:glycosyltransferase involved in cell wall biosynthesis
MAAYRLIVAWAAGSQFIVTSSAFSRDELVRVAGMDARRIRVIPLGAPPAVEGEARRPAGLDDRPFALVVGDNRPRKNLAILAKAWAALDRESPFELVSAGPIDRRFPSLAELGAGSGARGIRELGWVGEEELRWLYAHATLLLFPSRYEGFGFPLVEAFARETPAVAADIPTLREVGGDAAVFADPERPDEWADAIARLSRDPAERERRIAAGRGRAAKLTYRRTAAATLDLLREAAGRTEPALATRPA